MLSEIAFPLGLWLGSTSLLGAAAVFSIPKQKHERSMMLMGIGVFYVATLAVQVVSGIWLFFTSLSTGMLAVDMAFKTAFGMVTLTGVLVGIVGR